MLLALEELERSSEIQTQILEENPSPPVDWSDAATVKALMAHVETAALAQLGPAESSIIEAEHQIPMRDGFDSAIKIHRPAMKPSTGSPLVVLIYGGGFIAGSKDQSTGNARALVRLFGAVVVSISYRLGPEHQWPVPANDGWDSVKWIASHVHELAADPNKGFIVGGVSAGGTLALTITNLSLQEKLDPPITGQYLGIPSTMDTHHVPAKYNPYFLSHKDNAHAPVLDAAALQALATLNGWTADDVLRYPILFQDSVPLSSLPPTYFQVCGLDPIRDEALIDDEMLKEAGVRTKVDLYPGCPHGHWMFMPGLGVSLQAAGETNVGFGWLLGKETTAEEGLKAFAPLA
ncbi:hypothetical protein LTR53_012873 [Teratosphaeriaceae sp. CCFEE 6253]|nr:hypothetical protein LTR53_012873 [Teratosphaeriaceae sp. CCFEE 6253]